MVYTKIKALRQENKNYVFVHVVTSGIGNFVFCMLKLRSSEIWCVSRPPESVHNAPPVVTSGIGNFVFCMLKLRSSEIWCVSRPPESVHNAPLLARGAHAEFFQFSHFWKPEKLRRRIWLLKTAGPASYSHRTIENFTTSAAGATQR